MAKRPISHHKINFFNKGDKSIRLLVNMNFGNLRGLTTLVFRANQIIIYVAFRKYILLSSKVVSIEKDSNIFQINHTDLNCPEKIFFASNSMSKSSEELLSDIKNIGFLASAHPRDIPVRVKRIVRKEVEIIGGFICFLVCAPHIFLKFETFKTPAISKIISMLPEFLLTDSGVIYLLSFLLVISVAIRYSHFLQKIILKPKVKVKSIVAQLDLLTLILLVFLTPTFASGLNLSSLSILPLLLGVPAILFWHHLRAFLDEGI